MRLDPLVCPIAELHLYNRRRIIVDDFRTLGLNCDHRVPKPEGGLIKPPVVFVLMLAKNVDRRIFRIVDTWRGAGCLATVAVLPTLYIGLNLINRTRHINRLEAQSFFFPRARKSTRLRRGSLGAIIVHLQYVSTSVLFN